MTESQTEKYPIQCWSCRQPFNALDAGWCGCVSKERSLTCPSCLTCFCSAPRSYKKEFWTAAPQAMWDRKIAEHKKESVRPNPTPEDAQHPLVLIVDDEVEVQTMAIKAVESLGYEWVLAKNGEEGLAMATRYLPEVVLTDAMMPKLDGREMALKIKDRMGEKAPKIIVMTSLYTAAQYKYEALREFKVDDYTAKPLEFAKLQAMLEKYLD
jgi:CheY-like chemotaxis protein